MLTPAESIPAIAGSRTIVVNLDDTLNNFTEILQNGDFPFHPEHALSEATFEDYLRRIRKGDNEPGDLFSTGYSYFRFKIHLQCWRQARAHPDAVEFMQSLRLHRWRIIVCAQRDLRRAHDCTRAWLKENDIPFDYLFMAPDKVAFCKVWGIQHLIDRALLSAAGGSRSEVNAYFAMTPDQQSFPTHNAQVFQTFEEVKRWIHA